MQVFAFFCPIKKYSLNFYVILKYRFKKKEIKRQKDFSASTVDFFVLMLYFRYIVKDGRPRRRI